MVRDNRTPHGTAFTVSIEAATGVTTGISAHDRARTVQAAVPASRQPDDIVQPGHIFPLMAQNGGVLVRAGHTEAGCDLAQLAGLEPAAVICEILKDDGTMARLPDLIEFAPDHGLKIGAIRDLIDYRAANRQPGREGRREGGGHRPRPLPPAPPSRTRQRRRASGAVARRHRGPDGNPGAGA
jgi:3,4-dihydroxy 2-butanone 4-phosphate synthase/GTP cyclohydrolase II